MKNVTPLYVLSEPNFDINNKNQLIKNKHCFNKNSNIVYDTSSYQCKNLVSLTDPEYERLLMQHKLLENKFMSIESNDSFKYSNLLPKSHFSKEIIIPKDRSFIVSSVNDELYKNLMKEDVVVNNCTHYNLSLSSLKSNKNKSHFSNNDITRNQYEDMSNNTIGYTSFNNNSNKFDNDSHNINSSYGQKNSKRLVNIKLNKIKRNISNNENSNNFSKNKTISKSNLTLNNCYNCSTKKQGIKDKKINLSVDNKRYNNNTTNSNIKNIKNNQKILASEIIDIDEKLSDKADKTNQNCYIF